MRAHGAIGSDRMRGEGDSARARPAGTVWRRVLVSLWLLVFGLAGAALAASWDALMARLAGPPASSAGGALR